MSRKTRKLIWSAPLVAVLAVAGALAIFVALSPQEAAAHEAAMHGVPGPVTGLDANPASDDPTTGELEGRSTITITWNAPDTAASGVPTGYRIDYSDDSRIWQNLVPNHSETMADADCGTSADADQRCYTDMGLKPGQKRYYRVFAMNASVISPVSFGPTYDYATTVDYATPSVLDGLTATTKYDEKIDLSWRAPSDNGGADVMWYCLHVAALGADFGTLDNAACRDATDATNIEATSGNYFDNIGDLKSNTGIRTPVVIVLPGSDTTFSHTGLSVPDVLSLRYVVYVVTDVDGDEDETTIEDRRIALAASNIAVGSTISALLDISTPVTVTPGQVKKLRWVVSGTDTDTNGAIDDNSPEMSLYWQVPDNYPDPRKFPDDAVKAAAETAKALNWVVKVQRSVTVDGKAGWVDLTIEDANENGTGLTQFMAVALQGTDTDIDPLATADQRFRVFYENDHDGDRVGGAAASKGIEGVEKQFVVKQLTVDDNTAGDLPVIMASADTTNGGSDPANPAGLRFRHNEDAPTTAIDLLWDADDSGNGDPPTGYEIDISYDGGMTWEYLPNVQSPTDLGATREYVHRRVVPGQRYTYRVFPEFENRYGMPAEENASARDDKLPPRVEGLTVTGKGASTLKLNWTKVNKPGKHDVMGYLVQIAMGDVTDNDMELHPVPGWVNLGVKQTAPDLVRLTVAGADNTMYTYKGVARDTVTNDLSLLVSQPDGTLVTTFTDDLQAGNVRWFRVIAITAENDGDDTTGGTDVVLADGSLRVETPSPSEDLPEPDDLTSAKPAKGMTGGPAVPDAQDEATPPGKPMGLTAEEASDTNLIEQEERGVLLLWNEPKMGSTITSYLVQRRIDGGTEEIIKAITWSSATDPDQRTSYSDSREPVATEMLEYRVGSRGSAVTETQWADWIMYPADHHVSGGLTKPTNVMAMSDAAGELTLTWQGAENADRYLLIAVDMSGARDTVTGLRLYKTASVNGGESSRGEVTGLVSGRNYLGIVVALKGSGATRETEYDFYPVQVTVQ